jgi:hypothetical protein
MKDKIIPPPEEVNEEIEQAELEAEVKAKKQDRKKLFRELTGSDDVSLATILAGDILAGKWFKQNIFYIIFITLLTIVYVSNRYFCQQEQIETKQLNDELLDMQYKLLTTSSELRKNSRASSIEKLLQDSTLQAGTTPNFKLTRDGISER